MLPVWSAAVKAAAAAAVAEAIPAPGVALFQVQLHLMGWQHKELPERGGD